MGNSIYLIIKLNWYSNRPPQLINKLYKIYLSQTNKLTRSQIPASNTKNNQTFIENNMTCASTTNNFLLTNLDCAQLIYMPSQFTSSEAKFFRDLFEQLINFNISKIILDFGETNFISSEGLVSLCQILKQARDTKINLTFSRFSPQMKIVLSLVGLEDIFPVETELFVRKQN